MFPPLTRMIVMKSRFFEAERCWILKGKMAPLFTLASVSPGGGPESEKREKADRASFWMSLWGGGE